MTRFLHLDAAWLVQTASVWRERRSLGCHLLKQQALLFIVQQQQKTDVSHQLHGLLPFYFSPGSSQMLPWCHSALSCQWHQTSEGEKVRHFITTRNRRMTGTIKQIQTKHEGKEHTASRLRRSCSLLRAISLSPSTEVWVVKGGGGVEAAAGGSSFRGSGALGGWGSTFASVGMGISAGSGARVLHGRCSCSAALGGTGTATGNDTGMVRLKIQHF
jgi:hypothetical protein